MLTRVAILAALAGGTWALYALVREQGGAAAPTTTGATAMAARGDPAPAAAADPNPTAAAAVPATTTDRFKLVGVVAGGNGGLALIAVDGKPARTFRVGETVDGEMVVRSVSPGGATLGPRDGAAAVTLEVSSAPAPATSPAPASLAPLPTMSERPLNDGSAESQKRLREAGSKYGPIAGPTAPVPSRPESRTPPAVDDGRWRPPGGG